MPAAKAQARNPEKRVVYDDDGDADDAGHDGDDDDSDDEADIDDDTGLLGAPFSAIAFRFGCLLGLFRAVLNPSRTGPKTISVLNPSEVVLWMTSRAKRLFRLVQGAFRSRCLEGVSSESLILEDTSN